MRLFFLVVGLLLSLQATRGNEVSSFSVDSKIYPVGATPPLISLARDIFALSTGLSAMLANPAPNTDTNMQVAVDTSETGVPYSIGEALDAPHLSWTISSNKIEGDWFYQTNDTLDGDAIQTISRSSWVETIVTGPGTLGFAWKKQFALSPWENFSLYLNGSNQHKSASDKWEREIVLIPSGVHTLRWHYSRDAKDFGIAWLDQVIYPDGLPVFLVQPTNQTVISGHSTSIDAVAAGREMSYQWVHNGQEIPGATGARYELPNPQPEDA
ncbi:MAG: hypothetical protein ACK4UN_06940, partial [Limisphaerales bacterium]